MKLKQKKNRRSKSACVRGVLGLAVGALAPHFANAQATWDDFAASQDWNDLNNWLGNPAGANVSVNTAAVGAHPIIFATPTNFTPNDIIVANGTTTTGRLDHTAGAAATGNNNWLYAGNGGSSIGTYNLAGTAGTGGTYTNFAQGIGSMSLGGTSTTGGRMVLGNGGTSSGTFNMNTTGTLTAGEGTGLIAGTNGGDGTVNLDGGTINIKQMWFGDNNANSHGVLNMSGGTINATGNIEMARGGGSAAATMTGGTITTTAEIFVGRSGTATFDQSAGAVSTGAWFVVGRDNGGNGTYNLTGGTVNAATTTANSFAVIGSFAGSQGNLNVSGGSFTIGGNRHMIVGEGGTGTVTVSGTGTVTVNNTANGGIRLAANAGSVGTVNLNGGTIEAQMISKGGGTTGTFNFNGGTLKTTANSPTLMTGLTRANVRDNGAVIDTNSFNATIAQPLLQSNVVGDAGTGGLTKNGAGTLTLTGASTYTGTTTIGAGTLEIGAGGTTGSLASGPITNNAALIFNRSDASTQGNAISGSGTLTKNGAGTVTLSGANTYSGATNVNVGTLGFSTSQSNIGPVTVADGAGLRVQSSGVAATTLTSTSLNLGTAGATTLTFDFNGQTPTAPQIVTGGLSLNGSITVALAGTSGLTTSVIKLIDYTTLSGGSFAALTPTSFNFGHTQATLVDNTVGTSVDLNVVGDSLVWSGAGTNNWVTATTDDSTGPNAWATKNGAVPTNFWAADTVEFGDTYNTGGGPIPVTATTVNVSTADVVPTEVVFNNSAVNYTLTGGFGIGGTTTVTKNGAGTVTFANPNTYTGVTTINAGTLQIGNGTTDGSLASNSIVNNAALVFNTAVSSAYGGVISGNGTVTKRGAGTQVLSGASTYTGQTTIEAGVLSIAANNNLGANAAPVLLDGGTLRTTAGIVDTHPITIGAGGGTIAITGAGQLFLPTAGLLAGGGALAVEGNGTLLANGVGNLRVGAANTGYTGAVTIRNGGIFEYGAVNAVASTATFTLNNEGELTTVTGFTNPNSVTVAGGTNSVISFNNGTTGILSGSVALNANAIVGLRDWYNKATVRGGTISGQITGAGGITVNSGTGNGGLLTVSNANNTYAGGTTITASKVLAGTSAALGTGPVAVSGANAQLQLASGVNVANAITINAGAGTLAQGVVWIPTANANATVSGAITINNATAAGGHFAANGGTLTVTGAVTSSVPVTSRIGTVVFSNTGSSYGALNVQEGTVKLGATDAIPVAATVDLGLSAGASFDLAGFNQTLAGITKNVNAATVTNSGTADSTLTTTGTSTYAGIIQDGGTNKTALTVNGGSFTLSGVNTYTGTTTVANGSLLLTGAGTISSTLVLGTASTAGTLDVTGMTAASITLASVSGNGSIASTGKTVTITGTYAPGFSIGATSVSGNLGLGSNTNIELAGGGGVGGTDFDFVNVGGDLAYGGVLAVTSFGGYNLAQPGEYNLFDFATFSGDFTGVTVGGNVLTGNAGVWSGTFGDLTYTFTDNNGVLSVVPEPTSLGLFAIGAVGLLGRRRRRVVIA